MVAAILSSLQVSKLLRVNVSVKLDRPKLSAVTLKSSNPDPITDWNVVEYVSNILASHLASQ